MNRTIAIAALAASLLALALSAAAYRESVATSRRFNFIATDQLVARSILIQDRGGYTVGSLIAHDDSSPIGPGAVLRMHPPGKEYPLVAIGAGSTLGAGMDIEGFEHARISALAQKPGQTRVEMLDLVTSHGFTLGRGAESVRRRDW